MKKAKMKQPMSDSGQHLFDMAVGINKVYMAGLTQGKQLAEKEQEERKVRDVSRPDEQTKRAV